LKIKVNDKEFDIEIFGNKAIINDNTEKKIEIKDDKMIIDNKEFYLDLEDYVKIKDLCWSEKNNLYIYSYADNKMIYLHRFIMNVTNDEEQVDHVNHLEYDNRKDNLRVCSVSENQRNKKMQYNSTSKHTGVNWDKDRNQWKAIIFDGKGKCIFIGRFNTIEEAIYAREQKALEMYGNFKYDKDKDLKNID
jgi:hypothetical protein